MSSEVTRVSPLVSLRQRGVGRFLDGPEHVVRQGAHDGAARALLKPLKARERPPCPRRRLIVIILYLYTFLWFNRQLIYKYRMLCVKLQVGPILVISSRRSRRYLRARKIRPVHRNEWEAYAGSSSSVLVRIGISDLTKGL